MGDKVLDESITRVLRDVVEQRTLSLEAVEAIKKLRDDFEKCEVERARLANEYRIASSAVADLKVNISDLKNKVTALEEREENVLEREVICITTEIKNEFQEHRITDLKETLSGLVRNTEYRRHMFDCRSGPDANGAYATHTVNVDENSEAV